MSSRFYDGLASFARVAMFDPRGVGMSDPVLFKTNPTWEDATEDFRVVMDAAGFKRPALFVNRESAMPGLLFAGTEPERLSALIECNGAAYAYREPGYDAGHSRESAIEISRSMRDGWGTEEWVARFNPSLSGDPDSIRLLARMLRASSTPRCAKETMRYATSLDARPFLKSIRVPALIFHSEHYPIATLAMGRYLAEQIPDARLVVLPGGDFCPYASSRDLILAQVYEFLTGTHAPESMDTVLETVLFVDLVGSTELAAKLGDRRWKDLLEQFYRLAREALASFGGREIDTAGDGLFASFKGPGRAIRCAAQMRDRLREFDLELRAGVHTGECEQIGNKLAGMTVNIGARVCSKAAGGQIMVSGTVKDLLVGSGSEFADSGTHNLKGVPGDWRLYLATCP